MAGTFSQLKKTRSKGIDRLSQKIEDMDKSGNYTDDRIWKPTPDKTGKAVATIRFLPAPQGEEDPFVRRYNHGFKVNGKWLIENCPTTLGLPCPICEANSEAWNSGDEDTARQRKRKTSYYSNILVIDDRNNPDNNGKVFLFRYGIKIYEKIQSAIKGDIKKPLDPFDFWEGADFILAQTQVAGYPNYDSSSFESPSQLFDGDDAQLKEIWEQEYSLQEFIAEDQFKSYDELQTQFNSLYGKKNSAPATAEQSVEEESNSTLSLRERLSSVSTQDESEADAGDEEAPFTTDEESSTDTTDEDDDLKRFESMLEDD